MMQKWHWDINIYSEVIVKKLAQSLNPGALVFFVVGNRTVKNHNLPSDVFFQESFAENGLNHIKTITRKISNKSMPKINSPSNISGQTQTTMNDEFIVVMQKPKYQ